MKPWTFWWDSGVGSPSRIQAYIIRCIISRSDPSLQQPRIPIWVGGNWPHLGLLPRAAGFDGFCGGKEHAPDEPWCLTPAEVRDLKETIAKYRTATTTFDLALGGAERSAEWEQERATITALEEAGATWWMEYIAVRTLEETRARIARGPLRLD